jgi:glutathione S-transferase
LKKHEEWRDRIVEAMAKGYAALRVMETQLQRTPFLTGEEPTVADVALYAYTHVAGDGGYDLDELPAVQAWLARFSALPGFVPMPCTAPA